MRQGLLAFLILTGATLVALTPARSQGLPSWSEKSRVEWWTKNPTPDTWTPAANALQMQLEAAYKQNGARVFADADFRGWMEHLQWVSLGLAFPDVIAAPDDLKTFVALGQDEAVSHLLVEKLDARDLPKQALANILHLSQANAADLHEYAALGVAYSLVFDQPFPRGWPHRQVVQSAVPLGDDEIVARFKFYVQANRDKKTELDLTRLSFENLKFVVDSQVKLSELAYAQKKQISYSQFGDTYFSIRYDHDRISPTANVYDWPHSSYELAEIEKDGGICIDQAYYGAMIGKGRGIPTMVFTGYGMDGAHAWLGYMGSSGKWELDVGRYEQQDFPKGFTVDPQTWQAIDDATLQNLFKNGVKNPNYIPAMAALAWAREHRQDAKMYAAALDDAHNIMPEWSGTWRLQAEALDQSNDLDPKKKFYKDWTAQFGNFPDLKVEGQKRLYLALKDTKDPDADGVLKDIILQNREAGFDLGIEAGADAMNDKLKDKDWDAARTAFERTLRDFGQRGGLTLYNKVVRPYIEACLEGDKADMAKRAVDFTQDRMNIDSQTQLGQEFTKLKEEVAAKKR